MVRPTGTCCSKEHCRKCNNWAIQPSSPEGPEATGPRPLPATNALSKLVINKQHASWNEPDCHPIAYTKYLGEDMSEGIVSFRRISLADVHYANRRHRIRSLNDSPNQTNAFHEDFPLIEWCPDRSKSTKQYATLDNFICTCHSGIMDLKASEKGRKLVRSKSIHSDLAALETLCMEFRLQSQQCRGKRCCNPGTSASI
jgi:hypothetical protein